MRDQHDIPVLLTGCLAAGGAGMFLIMSVLIGFGVSTLIGREAMYLCLLLELVNLLVLHARAGALLRSGKAPQPSPKMRLLRRVSGIGWLTGAVLLVGSLRAAPVRPAAGEHLGEACGLHRRAGHDAQLGRLPDRIPPPAHVRCGLCAGERKGAAAMIRDLFLDLDDTLLDFGEAERHGILRTLRELGIAPTEETLALYSRINQQQWERFERGEISREQVLIERFSLLFQALGCAHDPEDAENRYRRYLGIGHWFVPGAEALLSRLAPRYRLYLASNGVADTQYSRLESAGISHYFQEIFISEDTGFHKPEKGYFDYCFARIPDFDPAMAMIVGDSLTSDILGGKNAGLRTCWFNRTGRPPRPDIVPDFEIHRLEELPDILEQC